MYTSTRTRHVMTRATVRVRNPQHSFIDWEGGRNATHALPYTDQKLSKGRVGLAKHIRATGSAGCGSGGAFLASGVSKTAGGRKTDLSSQNGQRTSDAHLTLAGPSKHCNDAERVQEAV